MIPLHAFNVFHYDFVIVNFTSAIVFGDDPSFNRRVLNGVQAHAPVHTDQNQGANMNELGATAADEAKPKPSAILFGPLGHRQSPKIFATPTFS